MEEAFFDVPLYREFAQLDAHGRMPDESTILPFATGLKSTKQLMTLFASSNLWMARGQLMGTKG